MAQPMGYRQWLQRQVDTHSDGNTRKQANALLEVVGDDQRIDDGWMNNPLTGIFSRPGNYSKQTIINLNDQFKRMYANDMQRIKDSPIIYADSPAPSNQKTSTVSTYNPAAAQAARDNSLKIADINERLARMPGSLDRINRAEQNKYALIENSYNRNNAELDDSWKQTQEDYNIATKNRLANRRRQIGVADDDFKKQNDAYARYFARSGSGSSSAAQYTVPTLLARATQKIRNDIETNNAENAEQQQTSYNRSLYNYKKEKNSLLNQREEQRQAAKQSFDTQRSGYFDQLAALEREKANYKNRSVADVLAAGRAASDQAERYANDAVNAGGVTEGMKYTPVSYEAVKSKDWTYDPTKTKVENPEGEQDDDSLYQKYFRDKEEDKKKKGWLAGVGA